MADLSELEKIFGKAGKVAAEAFASNFVASQIDKTLTDFEEKAVGIINAFGSSRDRIVEMKASMADAVESVRLLGGDMDKVGDIAKDVGTSLNRNIILTSDAYSKLYATQKVTELSASELTTMFKDAGYSIYQVSENMTKVVNIALQSGINAEAVSKAVKDNIGLLDTYNFAGGIEGLAKMAAQAVNLRTSVATIEKTMSKAFEPEGAIDMAAALQRLGVAQSDLLDPLRLMDLVQNDPAELQNQIAEMSKTFVRFNEQTKSFEIAPGAKRQLREVAGALGMTSAELAKMAKASAELDDKMQKISFPANAFTEEQQKFVANMAEMGEGGQYMLRVDNKDLKLDEAMKLFQEQPKVLDKFMKETKEPKTMEQLAKDQLTTQERMNANINSIRERMGAALASSELYEEGNEAMVKLSETIPTIFSGESFKIPTMREGFESVGDEVKKMFETGDIMGGLTKMGEMGGKYFEDSVKDLFEGGGKAMDDLSKSTNGVIKIFTDLTKKVAEFEGFFDKGLEKNTTTNTVEPKTNTEKLKVDAVIENSKTTSTSLNEIKFSDPLKFDVSITGLPPGMNEEQVINIFKQIVTGGKFDEYIYNSTKRGESQKTG